MVGNMPTGEGHGGGGGGMSAGPYPPPLSSPQPTGRWTKRNNRPGRRIALASVDRGIELLFPPFPPIFLPFPPICNEMVKGDCNPPELCTFQMLRMKWGVQKCPQTPDKLLTSPPFISSSHFPGHTLRVWTRFRIDQHGAGQSILNECPWHYEMSHHPVTHPSNSCLW